MKKRISIIVMAFMLIGTTAFAQPINYTVKPGDNLWDISRRYGCCPNDLMKLNPSMSNPRVIKPGQQIAVPSPTDTMANFEKEVIRLTNAERAKSGLPALSENPQISKVARLKSQDMADKGYFSHQSPTYGSPFQMMQSFGLRFSAAAENIAYGQGTPQEVVTAWMNSPGHRANMLSRSCSQIGVGMTKNKSGSPYWTQMFMQPTGK